MISLYTIFQTYRATHPHVSTEERALLTYVFVPLGLLASTAKHVSNSKKISLNREVFL